MEKFFGLIIVLIIFVVGRVLEAIQRKQMEEQRKSRPQKPSGQPYEPPRRQPSSQPTTQKKEGYQASQVDVEDFLRTIGMLPQKQETSPPPPAKPSREPQKQATVSSSKADKAPQPVAAPSVHEPVVEPKTEEISPLLHQEGIYASQTVKTMLHEKGSLKKAFILSEILQPPVSLRRSRSII